MPVLSTRSVARSNSSGLTVDANATSIAGGATITAGLLLATAVGTAVAPAPTLGTIALGGGILAVGQRDKLMSRKPAASPDEKARAAKGEGKTIAVRTVDGNTVITVDGEEVDRSTSLDELKKMYPLAEVLDTRK